MKGVSKQWLRVNTLLCLFVKLPNAITKYWHSIGKIAVVKKKHIFYTVVVSLLIVACQGCDSMNPITDIITETV